jgi:hypothetical protein
VEPLDGAGSGEPGRAPLDEVPGDDWAAPPSPLSVRAVLPPGRDAPPEAAAEEPPAEEPAPPDIAASPWPSLLLEHAARTAAIRPSAPASRHLAVVIPEKYPPRDKRGLAHDKS